MLTLSVYKFLASFAITIGDLWAFYSTSVAVRLEFYLLGQFAFKLTTGYATISRPLLQIYNLYMS